MRTTFVCAEILRSNLVHIVGFWGLKVHFFHIKESYYLLLHIHFLIHFIIVILVHIQYSISLWFLYWCKYLFNFYTCNFYASTIFCTMKNKFTVLTNIVNSIICTSPQLILIQLIGSTFLIATYYFLGVLFLKTIYIKRFLKWIVQYH